MGIICMKALCEVCVLDTVNAMQMKLIFVVVSAVVAAISFHLYELG